MIETKQPSLFGRINGAPAHALIIAGFLFLLVAPLIPSFRAARVARAHQEFTQVDALLELDLEDLKRSQEKERKDEVDAAQRDDSVPINYATMTPEAIEKQQQERRAREIANQDRERERQKVVDEKQEELKKKYDAHKRKRAWLEAQMAATGMRWHLVLAFLGNAMLLIGLTVVTLESEGTRQKVALVILLVAMFSALSGVSLNFLTLGTLGDRPPNFEQILREP